MSASTNVRSNIPVIPSMGARAEGARDLQSRARYAADSTYRRQTASVQPAPCILQPATSSLRSAIAALIHPSERA